MTPLRGARGETSHLHRPDRADQSQPVQQRSCRFIDEGIPAVLTIEGADGANDNIHTANDTVQFVDVDVAMESSG
jgi:Zn-dependent M28 family amino/carboxypeptidase